jgi:dihydrolipoamide dehydrogenase
VRVQTAEGVKLFRAPHVVLATGSSPIEIPGFKFSDGPVLDSTKALALPSIPKHLVVIGGGYIGLELGGVMARLGGKVTVVEMMGQLLPGFDPDVVKVVERRLKKDGVTVHLETKALGWETRTRASWSTSRRPTGKVALPADYVLVTVGRRPNSEGLGLEALGVVMEGPFVKVDGQRRRASPGMYAIGDVAWGTRCSPTRPRTRARSGRGHRRPQA